MSPPLPSGPGSQAQRTTNAADSRPAAQTRQQRLELLAFGRLDHVVGIEPEGIIAGGVRQGRVPGRGEVVDPDEIEHPRPERAGDFDGAVLAAGIDDDDLIEEPAHRSETMRKVLLLVPDDHGERDASPVRRGSGTARRRCPRMTPMNADDEMKPKWSAARRLGETLGTIAFVGVGSRRSSLS